ncbi:MAG: hypothetical protein SGPRY_012927, partial [Prymnesium sp.]
MADEEVSAELEAMQGQQLISAAQAGALSEVQRLLSSGVPVGFSDDSGWTPLMWAASSGHDDVVSLLLENGASDAEVKRLEPEMSTPLHWAAYKGHTRIIWKLLTDGKIPTASFDSEGNTPLHLAAAGGHLLAIKTMLSQGVDVHLKNSYGNTALSLTTSEPCRKLLKEASKHDRDAVLCSGSGEFISAKDSVAMQVIDAVSSPTPRPVRYSTEYYARIKAAEDLLYKLLKGSDTAALEAAINAAKDVGASQPLLDEGIIGHARLKAQISLQTVMDEVERQRPIKDARDKDVQQELIESADKLCKTTSLFDYCHKAEAYLMSDESSPEPPSAESDFALKAEGVIAMLAQHMSTAQANFVMEEVIHGAEILHRRLTSESELRKAMLEAKEETNPEDGTVSYVHYNGQKSMTKLDNLQLRSDWLDAAIDKCVSNGLPILILEAIEKTRKVLKAELKQAVIEDEERKAKEAAAAAKAAKKKK